jgi:hypothetical protein
MRYLLACSLIFLSSHAYALKGNYLDWPIELEKAFLASCEGVTLAKAEEHKFEVAMNQLVPYCKCSFNGLREKVTYQEFLLYNQALKAGKKPAINLPSIQQQIASVCEATYPAILPRKTVIKKKLDDEELLQKILGKDR